MKTVTLPNTEITVSQLVFGCWGITSDFHWGQREESESVEAMNAAFDAGVNFFDTAPMYAAGESEKLVGRVFAGRRDQLVIATKIDVDAMRPDDVIAACERSLERLGTDFVDLYQTHWFADRDVPPEDTWGAMIKLRDQGKVRAIGVCNGGVGDLTTISAQEAPVTNQLPYNLLWRMIEEGIVPKCAELGSGILVYSPLMHALLAGKYSSAADVPDGRARSRHFTTERELARHGEGGCEDETFAAIAAVRKIAEEAGRSMSDVALQWLLAKPGVAGVIAGARNAEQLHRNVKTLGSELPADVVQALDDATDALATALGPNPDMWQGSEGSRYN